MSRKVSCLILIGYVSLLSYWMLFGFGRRVGLVYMYNLELFATIKHFFNFSRLNTYVWVINLVGNIGVFIPFGFLIPIIYKPYYFKGLSIFLIGVTFLEVLQLITRRGSFDVDDFILNALGFTLGYVVFRILAKWGKQRGDRTYF